VRDELSVEWNRLSGMKNFQQRGYAFEAFIAAVLQREHFSVEKHVSRANRRQVDIFASRGDRHYLIETKWRSKKTGIPEVDNLLTRLQTAPPSVTGLLVSKSGFS
jgi:hypothetical protein